METAPRARRSARIQRARVGARAPGSLDRRHGCGQRAVGPLLGGGAERRRIAEQDLGKERAVADDRFQQPAPVRLGDERLEEGAEFPACVARGGRGGVDGRRRVVAPERTRQVRRRFEQREAGHSALRERGDPSGRPAATLCDRLRTVNPAAGRRVSTARRPPRPPQLRAVPLLVARQRPREAEPSSADRGQTPVDHPVQIGPEEDALVADAPRAQVGGVEQLRERRSR